MHTQNLHPGLTLTFHLTRQQFWIVGGRSSTRKIVHKCVVCFKNNAKTSKQLMGDLPVSRLRAARPFTSCGIDYAGPIQIASKRGRGARFTKGYIAIFVCMATKAVHIDAVTDLSTDAFIATLKRFVSRRGAPAHIYSDNGSNFIGAHRKLNEVYKLISQNNHNSIVAEFLANSEIQWHFIPPMSPHFGGLWEAAVKSVKSHLVKYSSHTHLTFEEMVTLLTQIEAILNSRPLYATADDDANINVLSPAHFLIGSSNFYVPEEEISGSIPTGRLSRWQFIQQRVQAFWKKFSFEYLHNLQQRMKWRKLQQNLKVGDIVLVKEDNLPSYKWLLGKIVELHPNDQGLVRVVTLKTSKSILKRPIVKLCKLPVEDDG